MWRFHISSYYDSFTENYRHTIKLWIIARKLAAWVIVYLTETFTSDIVQKVQLLKKKYKKNTNLVMDLKYIH